MSKSAKKRAVAPSSPVVVAKPAQLATSKTKRPNSEPSSKQARVVAMLMSPAGATIDATMKATGCGLVDGRRVVDQDRLGIRRIEQERTKSLSLCRWLTFQLRI